MVSMYLNVALHRSEQWQKGSGVVFDSKKFKYQEESIVFLFIDVAVLWHQGICCEGILNKASLLG